jgi:hypothetical protein
MAKPLIRVDGMRAVRRAMRDAGDDMADLRDLHRKLADDVADLAQAKTPVRSGRLQRSVRGRGTKTSARVLAGNNRASGPSAVPYAGRIHFGDPGGRAVRRQRGRIKPSLFLYDALDEQRREIVDAYNDQLRDLIRRKF